MSDGGCQLIKVLADEEEVQRNWLYPETGSAGAQVRVGCASEILDNSPLFRSRNAQADIDIETLQRIIEQDAPSNFGSSIFNSTTTPLTDGIVYCAISEETYRDLQDAASLKNYQTRCALQILKCAVWRVGQPIRRLIQMAKQQSLCVNCVRIRPPEQMALINVCVKTVKNYIWMSNGTAQIIHVNVAIWDMNLIIIH